MDLFQELISVSRAIKKYRHLLIGGMAYAVYVEPRATQDIDFLICQNDLIKILRVLNQMGFLGQPNLMEFKKAKLARCIKVKGTDTLIVDFLLLSKKEFDKLYHRHIIIKHGKIKLNVISAEDLIKLKQRRATPQDKVDIMNLQRCLRKDNADQKIT